MSVKKKNYTPKIVDGICPLCGGKEFSSFTNVRYNKIACDNCKAVFYAPDHADKTLANYFTGTYAPLSRENLYKQ